MQKAKMSLSLHPIVLAVLLLIVLVYNSSLCHDYYWYDSAEFSVAANLLGIPHPTGYPLYVMLAHYATLFTPWNPALGVNGLSLLCSIFVLCGIALFLAREGLGIIAQCSALLILAATPVFWEESVVAEVYSLNLLILVMVFLSEQRWRQEGDSRYGYATAFLFGVGLSNHVTLIFVGPALLWNRLRRAPDKSSGEFKPRPSLLLAGTFFMFGLSLYLYLPIRAQGNPSFNIGDPDTIAEFLRILRGGQFYKYFFSGDAANQALYFDRPAGILLGQMTIGICILALIGMCTTLGRKRIFHGLFLSIVFFTTLFLIVYGVHDIEFFASPLILVVCLWAAFGVESLMGRLNDCQSARTGTACDSHSELPKGRIARILTAALLFTLFTRFLLAFPLCTKATFHEARQDVHSIYAKLPSGAFLMNKMVPEDWFRFAPIWYSRYCEHERFDLTVMDDMGFWKLQRSKPQLPTYVLHDDLVLRGRYHLQPHGPVWLLEEKKFVYPSDGGSFASFPIDISAITNADYRHDPFTPNPEMGSSHFFPHLMPGTLYWHGVPFTILPPYDETSVPSVMTTCFQESVHAELSLRPCPTHSLWLLVDGGVQKHRRVLCARLIVELENGQSIIRDVYSFDDVWEHFNFKNDYPVPAERLAYGEMENVSLSVLPVELPEGAIPRKLIIEGGASNPEETWYPGITLFAVTQQVSRDCGTPQITESQSAEEFAFISLTQVANADYRHDPFSGNPEIGLPMYPDLMAGILRKNRIQFSIQLPYDVSLVPPILTLNSLTLPTVQVPLEKKLTQSLWIALTGRFSAPEGDVLAECTIDYSDKSRSVTQIRASLDLWDAEGLRQQEIPESSILWGGGGTPVIQLVAVPVAMGKIPSNFRISVLDRGPRSLSCLSIFALTQEFATSEKDSTPQSQD